MEHVRLAREDRLLTANTPTMRLVKARLLVAEVNRDPSPPNGSEEERTFASYKQNIRSGDFILALRGIDETPSKSLSISGQHTARP
jgi:hypothetical protein